MQPFWGRNDDGREICSGAASPAPKNHSGAPAPTPWHVRIGSARAWRSMHGWLFDLFVSIEAADVSLIFAAKNRTPFLFLTVNAVCLLRSISLVSIESGSGPNPERFCFLFIISLFLSVAWMLLYRRGNKGGSVQELIICKFDLFVLKVNSNLDRGNQGISIIFFIRIWPAGIGCFLDIISWHVFFGIYK